MLGVKYFEVELKDGKIELKPLRVYESDLEKIRSKMKNLGLKPDSAREAVEWARSKCFRLLLIPMFLKKIPGRTEFMNIKLAKSVTPRS